MLYALEVFITCMDPLVNSFCVSRRSRSPCANTFLSNAIATDSVTFSTKTDIHYTEPQECPFVSPTNFSWAGCKTNLCVSNIAPHFHIARHACDHENSPASLQPRTRKWCCPTKFGHVPSSRFDYELLLMSRFFFGDCQIDGRHDPDDIVRLHLSEKFRKPIKQKYSNGEQEETQL